MARHIGKNLDLFSANSLALIAHARSCEIIGDVETQENRALGDAWSYPIARINNWTLRATIASATGKTYTGTKNNTTYLMGLQGTSVTLSFRSASSVLHGTVYSGTGILKHVGHTVPDGLQEVSIEIEGQGALTVTQA